jgi:MraZ protein
MFRGLNAVAIDEKGRIAIPARYRSLILADADGLLVSTIDTEARCLLLYPYPHWQSLEQRLEALPSYHPASRRIQRLLIGHAAELELDRSGRILIPPLLREYAGLVQMAMLVGQGKKIEIWSDSEWERARKDWLSDPPSSHPEIPPELRNLSL